MATNWNDVFDDSAGKRVTATDVKKRAYVVPANQRALLARAGYTLTKTLSRKQLRINVLHDPNRRFVHASYYLAIREPAGNRAPEARIGQDFISQWLRAGDWVVFGLVGNKLFAVKDRKSGLLTDELHAELAKRANAKTVWERATRAKGKPRKLNTVRQDFVRNQYVVAAAKLRSCNRCEMPGCRRALFKVDRGASYIEVHHLIPLAEGGDDTLDNVAALCPHCHRELHFGAERAMKLHRLRKSLIRTI